MLPMSECWPEATLDRRRHSLGVEAPPSSLQLSNRFGKEDRVFVATSMAGSPRAWSRGQGLEYGAAQVNKIKAEALERIRSEDRVPREQPRLGSQFLVAGQLREVQVIEVGGEPGGLFSPSCATNETHVSLDNSPGFSGPHSPHLEFRKLERRVSKLPSRSTSCWFHVCRQSIPLPSPHQNPVLSVLPLAESQKLTN